MFKTVHEARLSVEKLRGAAEERRRRRDKLKGRLDEIQADLPDYRASVLLARKCLDQCLEVRKEIADVVQSGLRDAFLKPFRFTFDAVHETKSEDNINIKGLKALFASPNGQLVDPRDDFSAGVVEVGSILLRLETLILVPETQPILVLDEGLSKLASFRWPRLGKYIEAICRVSGSQVIMATHEQNHPMGEVWLVEKKDTRKGEVSTARRVQRYEDENGVSWVPAGKA